MFRLHKQMFVLKSLLRLIFYKANYGTRFNYTQKHMNHIHKILKKNLNFLKIRYISLKNLK